jgi:hypothetical protein
MSDISVPENTIINDVRNGTDFKSISFSGYKKSEVKNQLIESLIKGKVEPACNWSAELICAGHYIDIWECILFYLGKHIHGANPKMVVYLEKRYKIFRNIIQQGLFVSELELRNNSTIRKLYAEIIIIVAKSPQKHSFETIKIDRVEEFDITKMSDRLKAPNVTYIEGLLDKDDPNELFIVINEFAYQISADSKNMIDSCFWIEWIIEFDHICKTRKEPVKCKRRGYSVENKFQKDIIWIVWDTLIFYGNKCSPFIVSILNSLIELFCIRYTTASSKKRKYLLYFAVELLTEFIPINVELTTKENKEMIGVVLEKIDSIYKHIKKNEHSPGTDYLFSGLGTNNNLEKSVKQLEILRSMDYTPRSTDL